MEIAVTDDQPDPIEALERKERLNLMRDVVTRLKPRYRTLIELRYFEEYSYEEIAEELDLPLGTVKAQLFRARDLLFQILKNTRERF
jgi:RNA polymerase sigma-70 factor (ECF subfamily)